MNFPCPLQTFKNTWEVTALQNLTWEDVEGGTIIKGHLQILIVARQRAAMVCAGTADRLSFSLQKHMLFFQPKWMDMDGNWGC